MDIKRSPAKSLKELFASLTPEEQEYILSDDMLEQTYDD